MGRAVAIALAAITVAAAVFALRAATLTTHEEQPPGSKLSVVVHARARSGEPGQTLAERAEAVLVACRLEVAADPVRSVTSLGDGRFRMVLRPALDRSDRRQLRGCLEDWRIDHVLLDVQAMTEQ